MSKWYDLYPEATPIDVALAAEGVTGKAAAIARSIYEQESGSGKNTKTSNAGAVGGMQVIPATFKRMADEGWDIADPIANARAGVRYVKALYERADGDAELTAAGYYGGEGAQDKARKGVAVSDPRNPKAPDTLQYAKQVAGRLPKDKDAPGDDFSKYPEVSAATTVDAKAPASKQEVALQSKRTKMEELARQLGLTVRAGVSGVAAVPAMVSDAATGVVNAGLDAVAGEGNGFRFQKAGDALGNVMTAAGLPKPENATERVVQDVASGMVGAGGFVGAGKALAGAGGAVTQAVGKQLAAGPGLQVGSAAAGTGAAGVTREEGGGAGAQLAAGLVGGLTPGLAVPTAKAAVRGALRGGEAGRQRVADNIAAFEAAGTTPTLGQATEGRIARATESLLAKTPGGAGVIAKRAQGQADDMAAAVQKLSDELAPGASAVNAGEAIAKGVRIFKEGFKITQNRLYSTLDKHIASDTPIQVTGTQQALKTLNADIPGAPSLSEFFKNAKIKGIDRALQADLDAAATSAADGNGALPYEAIKKLRTLVGNEIADNSLVSDVPRSKWTALYGALSDDLGVAAKNAGPQAEQAWQRANQFTKSQLARLEEVSAIVARDTPEKIFLGAISGTAEGDTIVKRVISMIPKSQRREVAAAVLQRMGRATPGQQNAEGNAFSSETFLSNLSKLSEPARKTLFGRTDVEGIEAQLGQFAKVAESRRDGGRVFANPSGTAPAAAQVALGGGIGGGVAMLATGNPVPLAAALAVPAGANAAARIMTNPASPAFAAGKTVLRDGAAASLVGTGSRVGNADEKPAAWWDAYPEVDPVSFEPVQDPNTVRIQLNGMAQPDSVEADGLSDDERAILQENQQMGEPAVEDQLPGQTVQMGDEQGVQSVAGGDQQPLPVGQPLPAAPPAPTIADIGRATTIDDAIAAAGAVMEDGASARLQDMLAQSETEAAAMPAPVQVSMALPTSAPNFNGEPAATWYGRRGDGYEGIGDATLALRMRQKVSPELSWRLETMPSGRHRLAGYAPEPTEAQPDAGMETMAVGPAPAFEPMMQPDGTLAILGDPAQIRQLLAQAGIGGSPKQGGVLVSRGQAQAAMEVLGAAVALSA